MMVRLNSESAYLSHTPCGPIYVYCTQMNKTRFLGTGEDVTYAAIYHMSCCKLSRLRTFTTSKQAYLQKKHINLHCITPPH